MGVARQFPYDVIEITYEHQQNSERTNAALPCPAVVPPPPLPAAACHRGLSLSPNEEVRVGLLAVSLAVFLGLP